MMHREARVMGEKVHLVSLVHLVPLCDKPDKLDKPN